MAALGRYVPHRPLLLLGFICGFLRFCYGYEVTLLDTRLEESLQWATYSRTEASPDGSSVGWRERSYNLPNGETTRVYTVCNVNLQNVDNWVRTPYIARGEANTLWLEIRFTMRKCNEYPDPKQLQQCKESFKLLYYEAESDFANHVLPTWDTDTYRHVDVVAADQTFQNIDEAVVNTETRPVDIKRQGVYFALHDQGACTAILSVRVYYIQCSAVTLNFASFEDTPAGAGQAAIVQKAGVCVAHAAIEKPPSYLCKADGQWYLLSGGCKCMPGYEPEGDKKCTACPAGKYKWHTGSYACRPCPDHSTAPSNGSVECLCVDGYYRNVKDDKSLHCTKPPSEIRSLNVTFVDQTMVNLSWEHPADLGGRRDISYRIACMGCPPTVIYRPAQKDFNTTKASLLGLSTSTKYKIIVTAENGVTAQSNIVRSASVVVTTEAAVPTQVRNLRVVAIGANLIALAWEHPYDQKGPVSPRIDTYEIRYYPQVNNANFSTVFTAKQNHTFKGLHLETAYAFAVRVKTSRGWGDYSPPITAKTGDILISDPDDVNKVNAPADNPVGIIAGSAVAVVVCMVIVIIMLIIFLRRNHRACNEKNVSDCDTLQYSNVQCPPVLDAAHMLNGGLTVPLFAPPGSLRTYIDPHTYEDPNQAVREFTKEIDASLITIESVIGGGEFGDVCKGKLRVPGKGELTVAIKTLKAGASDRNRLDFLTEASIMGQFDDPNVIYLEGVVTKSNPIMIVTEYMENGSLDQFLRNNDGKFTVIQLVGMMRGIAAGVRYLSDMGYVHRDLAARNTLVNESLVCKVADFGLSREIESDTTEGAYTTKGGKIPVRWTAPEAIAYRKFTSASDVWSYGVVMWEVMSYGERPYWNWSNQDVIKAVEKGFRLPPPMDCPEAIHQLMLDCWQKERSHRPKFSAIVKTLDKLIRAPELLRKIAKARPHNYFDPNAADLTSYDSVEDWLASIKMERYVDHFLQAGYTSMDMVANITLKELTALGVTLVGHQKKIMNSIQTLRAQLCDAQVSEGFLV